MCISDLRTRQRELGRQAIVDTCADLVTERHHLDFSMREVAEQAGVSLRTVYNHFPTRDDLLEALKEEFGQRMAQLGGVRHEDVKDLDGLLGAVATNNRIFRDLGPISGALAQLPLANVGEDAQRSERTVALVEMFTDAMADVPEDQARPIALVMRHMLSHRSWFWLTHEYGLDTDTATTVVQWAIRALVDAAEHGNLPSTTQDNDVP
ncbi:MAG: TetR/AcrR family transcriptional regulator [Microthrixaceae bacterium]